MPFQSRVSLELESSSVGNNQRHERALADSLTRPSRVGLKQQQISGGVMFLDENRTPKNVIPQGEPSVTYLHSPKIALHMGGTRTQNLVVEKLIR